MSDCFDHASDAYESYLNDGFSDSDPRHLSFKRYDIVCKFCGCDFLHWRQIDNKWKLFNEKGKQHNCHMYTLKKDIKIEDNKPHNIHKYILKKDKRNV